MSEQDSAREPASFEKSQLLSSIVAWLEPGKIIEFSPPIAYVFEVVRPSLVVTQSEGNQGGVPWET
ncbi:hypothetical protein ACVIGB_001085 [Bradyrhizobium sp. USDA 4341]